MMGWYRTFIPDNTVDSGGEGKHGLQLYHYVVLAGTIARETVLEYVVAHHRDLLIPSFPASTLRLYCKSLLPSQSASARAS